MKICKSSACCDIWDVSSANYFSFSLFVIAKFDAYMRSPKFCVKIRFLKNPHYRTRASPVAMETKYKGHIRRSTRHNHVVYHEALLSSNVRPVTPPLAGAQRANERAMAKRDEAYRGAPSAAGPRRRSARSRRAELSRGVLGRPGREAARDRSRSLRRIIRRLHGG